MSLCSGRYVREKNLGTSKGWSLRFACPVYMVEGHTPARAFDVNYIFAPDFHFLLPSFCRLLQLCGGPGKDFKGCPNSFAIGEERKSQVFAKPRFLDAVDAGAFRFMQDRRICSECHNALTRRGTTSSSEGGRFAVLPQCKITPRAYPSLLAPFFVCRKATSRKHIGVGGHHWYVQRILLRGRVPS